MTGDGDAVRRRNADLIRWYSELSTTVFMQALKALRGNRAGAEDVVQQVFVKVLDQYERDFAGQPEESVRRLITTITKRRALDWLRAQLKLSPLADDEELRLPADIHSDGPVERVLDEEAYEHLWGVMRRWLSPTEHAVALLYWGWGLTDEDIAGALAIGSVATVRSHRSRAKSKIAHHTGNGTAFPDQPDELGTRAGKGEAS